MKVLDISGNKNQRIKFLNTDVKKNNAFKDISKMNTEKLMEFCFEMSNAYGESESYYQWTLRAKKIDECYYDAVPSSMQILFTGEKADKIDEILTRTSPNKVREMTRLVTNMLMKNNPRFEPDPSGEIEDIKQEDLVTATRYLDYNWQRKDFVFPLTKTITEGVRLNRGIVKLLWDYEKKDISMEHVKAKDFIYDTTNAIGESSFYHHQFEKTLNELFVSGVFSKADMDKIEEGLGIEKEETDAGTLTKKIMINDFYLKTIKEGEVMWKLLTFVEDKILIRNIELTEEDMPFCFFVPEINGEEQGGHSMNDVANISCASSYVNYKIASAAKFLSDIPMFVDQRVDLDRTQTGGIRTYSRSSTDKSQAPLVSPVFPNVPVISSEALALKQSLDYAADQSYGQHPNALQANGPSNGVVAEAMLAGDLQNASITLQAYEKMLMDIARKILHIAYYMKDEETAIMAPETERFTSEKMKVVGGNVVATGEERGEYNEEQGINVLKAFRNIKVTVKPGSAYTDKMKQTQLLNLLKVKPDIAELIPDSVFLEAFAEGSANMFMHKAAKEAKDKEIQESNPQAGKAEMENILIESGNQQVVQPSDDHKIHDQVHLISEMSIEEQVKKARNEEEKQNMLQILELLRQHRQQHSMMEQQLQAQAEGTPTPSPDVIGANQQESEEDGGREFAIENMMDEEEGESNPMSQQVPQGRGQAVTSGRAEPERQQAEGGGNDTPNNMF